MDPALLKKTRIDFLIKYQDVAREAFRKRKNKYSYAELIMLAREELAYFDDTEDVAIFEGLRKCWKKNILKGRNL